MCDVLVHKIVQALRVENDPHVHVHTVHVHVYKSVCAYPAVLLMKLQMKPEVAETLHRAWTVWAHERATVVVVVISAPALRVPLLVPVSLRPTEAPEVAVSALHWRRRRASFTFVLLVASSRRLLSWN